MIQTMTANASTVIDIAVAIRAMDGWITALYCGARPAWGRRFLFKLPRITKTSHKTWRAKDEIKSYQIIASKQVWICLGREQIVLE